MSTPATERPALPDRAERAARRRRSWGVAALLGVSVFMAAGLVAHVGPPRVGVAAALVVLLVMVTLLRMVATSAARLRRNNQVTLAALQNLSASAAALDAEVSKLNATLRNGLDAEKNARP